MAMNNSPYQSLYESAGADAGLDPLLLRAQAIVESGENPDAVSPKGAIGVSQFIPDTAKTAGPNGEPIDPKDPKQAIPAQARLMRSLIDKASADPDLKDNDPINVALMEYHGGSDRTIWGSKTAAYPQKIAATYTSLKAAQKPAAATTPKPVANATDPNLDAEFEALTAKHDAANAPDPNLDTEFNVLTAKHDAANAPPPAPVGKYGPQAQDWGIPQAPTAADVAKKDTPAPNDTTLSDVKNNVLNAAKEGWKSAPENPLMTPEGVAWVDQHTPNYFGISPAGIAVRGANKLASVGLGVMGAGGKAAQEAAASGGAYVGAPELGRDVAGMMEAFPYGIEDPGAIIKAPERESVLPIHEHDTTYYPKPNEETGPANSVGAMGTPASAAKMSDKEVAAANIDNEKRLLNETAADRANKDGIDTTQYVPDSIPTQAEYTGHADTALKQKADFEKPETAQLLQKRLDDNNQARKDYYTSHAGGQSLINTLTEARDAQAKADEAAALANSKPLPMADAQGLVDHAQSIIDGPAGRVAPVRDAMKTIIDTLTDDKGQPITDPAMLMGANRQLNVMLSKAGMLEKPGLRAATAEIMDVKNKLQDAIESAAPGYNQYRQNYQNASKEIEARQLLQDYEPKLYDSKGNMTLGKVQSVLKDITQQRAAPGVSAAKSLTEDQMSALWNLRNDLQRQGNIDLGKARGSNTSQNLDVKSGLLQNALNKAKVIGAHAAITAVDPTGGVAGNILYQSYRASKDAKKAAADAAKDTAARADRIQGYLAKPPGWN